MAAVNRTVFEGVFADGIDWEDTPEPFEIRECVLLASLQITHVHSELVSYCGSLDDRRAILHSLLRCLATTSLHYVREIGYFSVNGALQLLIEMSFLRRKLQPLLTPEATKTFEEIQSFLSVQAGDNIQEDGSLAEKWDYLRSSLEISTMGMFAFLADEE